LLLALKPLGLIEVGKFLAQASGCLVGD
jgi:hypothetical protein